MDAATYLRGLVERELREDYGVSEPRHIEAVVRQWMDDEGDAALRFRELEAFQPGAKRILDMASGCGTAVFWGLRNGLDTFGIDPNPEKHRFISLKAEAYGYPRAWLSRFCIGMGEGLPYPDGTFDAVLSYQTLEHVRDPRIVLEEMLRVTRVGGSVNVRFPDYRGTFEAHYHLPWLPLMPRFLAEGYLRFLGRPIAGLEGIKYVTRPRVLRIIRSLSRRHPGWRLEVFDGNKSRFLGAMKARGLPAWSWLYLPYRLITHLRCLFRRDMGANLFIKVVSK